MWVCIGRRMKVGGHTDELSLSPGFGVQERLFEGGAFQDTEHKELRD